MAVSLAGKTVLITGGNGGLGRAQARAARAAGAAQILLADLPGWNSAEARAELESEACAFQALELNVTQESDWAALRIPGGRLDCLVNNAGVTKQLTFDSCSLDDWHFMVDVNQTGVFLGMKYGARLLREAGGGSMVNIASAAGLSGYFSAPYTATKWAVRGMTKTAAMEYADWNIRVNCVCPGFIRTPLTEKIRERVDGFARMIPKGRIGNPDEVAEAVVFLLSDSAAFINGVDLTVDGGMSNGGHYRMMAKDFGFYP